MSNSSLLPTMNDFQFVPGNRMEWNLKLEPLVTGDPDILHTGEWRVRVQIDGICQDQKFIAADPELTIAEVTNAIGSGTQFNLVLDGTFTKNVAERIKKGCAAKIVVEEGIDGNALAYFYQKLSIDQSAIEASL